jgi:hypothetical protein
MGSQFIDLETHSKSLLLGLGFVVIAMIEHREPWPFEPKIYDHGFRLVNRIGTNALRGDSQIQYAEYLLENLQSLDEFCGGVEHSYKCIVDQFGVAR